jgi:hypothetical protein
MRDRGAFIDGVYRYSLWRHLGDGPGRVLFVMLNPSTADETTDDPTIRRCATFATGWGYGHLEVCNLFAYRAIDPRQLRRVGDPVGPLNDSMIARADVVMGLLRSSTVYCVGTTRDGFPRHPLYLRGDSLLAPFVSVVREVS